MRLSEAIRLGAMLKPQGFGMRFDGWRTCAFGAALDAVGGLSDFRVLGDVVEDRWPWLAQDKASCPVCGKPDGVGYVIAECLNDEHEWTRERIADWVATREPQESAMPSEPVKVTA